MEGGGGGRRSGVWSSSLPLLCALLVLVAVVKKEVGWRERGEGSEEVHYNFSALLVLVTVVENCEQGWSE